jgi:hypothetical protein
MSKVRIFAAADIHGDKNLAEKLASQASKERPI